MEGMSRVLIYGWLPHQPLPECKYLYAAKKQLLLEPIQSTQPLTPQLCSALLGPRSKA